MADVPCLDHSLDGCEGFRNDAQTTIHMEPSLISDRSVLDGRSKHNKRTHGRNVRKPLLAHIRARLAPRAPVFEL